MSARRFVLALDQGTTGSTALVIDPDGGVRARGYAELPQHYPQPGWVEHDPVQIWATTVQALGRAVASSGITPPEIAAVGITNQRETTILWERASGRPVGNAIVWQCRRTAALCDRLKADGAEPEIRRKTGLVVDAYFSGTKIRWMLDHHPALRPRAERGELCFGTVDAWLLWQLTGGAVHATDPSNASRTLCYDIHRRAWDEGLCRILGVPMALLPEVKPSAGVFGETAAGRGAVWVANSGDATVSRIDSATNRVTETVTVGEGPNGVALDTDGNVWVSSELAGTLEKVDPASAKVVDEVKVGEIGRAHV